ncbi:MULTISPECIES: YebC/PmpR family DNA-binding transcriptional regulator [Bacteroides]|uniref:YebC/PmpR family DNA-binding transcriptional regulator n=1 Tax=Bacteroides TaxID=816 RepID=UPI001DB7980C|nr:MULTISPECIES: YebC/PmpR family DNA-binding transcriptional regulator [Bacteroides]HJD92129.1 YebC/PmpR family DNA-binding transcriptional regulator [Bacteroides coprosuis]
MGRAFEYRKARKLKRWGNMARVFTRVGKEISIAVKEGGPDPENNPRLRAIIQTAKRENMPKENVERAIKNAMGKDQKDYKMMNYEGYAPHGIAVFVETATDNTTRTVANVRAVFNKFGGSLGVSGSVDFMFKHNSVFTIAKKDDMSIEDLILELIDLGVEEEYEEDEEEVTIYAEFQSFNAIQTYLEENGFEIKSSEFTRIPMDEKDLEGDDRAEVEKMIERLEEDEDVQAVYSTLKPSDEDGDEE